MTVYPEIVSNELRFKVLCRDNFTCQYCGRKAPDVELEVDHIYPVSKGGKAREDNLVTSCVSCNSGKKDFVYNQLFEDDELEYWGKQKRKFPYGERTCYVASVFRREDGTMPILYSTIDKYIKKTIHNDTDFEVLKRRLSVEDKDYMRKMIIAVAKRKMTEEEYIQEINKRAKITEKHRKENRSPYTEKPNWKFK